MHRNVLRVAAGSSALQQCIYPNWQSSVSISDGKAKLPPAKKTPSQLLPLHLSAESAYLKSKP
jgi:hypothetical protein